MPKDPPCVYNGDDGLVLVISSYYFLGVIKISTTIIRRSTRYFAKLHDIIEQYRHVYVYFTISKLLRSELCCAK